MKNLFVSVVYGFIWASMLCSTSVAVAQFSDPNTDFFSGMPAALDSNYNGLPDYLEAAIR